MKKLINTKTIAIALCFVFVFLLGLTSLKKVEEVHASEGILKLSENEDGTFSVASGLRSLFSSNVIYVKKDIDSHRYVKIDGEKLFMLQGDIFISLTVKTFDRNKSM